MVDAMGARHRTTLIMAARAVASVVVLFGLVLIPAEAPAREEPAAAPTTTTTSSPAAPICDSMTPDASWTCVPPGGGWYGSSWYGVTFPAFWE
jgi:hypothetical protein